MDINFAIADCQPSSNGALGTLSTRDLVMFERFRVPKELLAAAHVQRVSDLEARDCFGVQYSGDKSGIIFPYYVGDRRVTARLRRDNPEVDLDGKPQNKYVSAWGDRRHCYFPPAFQQTVHADPGVPVVAVESEKGALAGTAWARRTGARLAFFATGGCYGWIGRIGKTESANGSRVAVKGPIPDLAVCDGRKVYILFDSNVATNPKVAAAERKLVAELRTRKCEVRTCRIPIRENVNGPDDLIAVSGDDALADVITKAQDPETPDTIDGIPVYSEGNLARRFAELYGETLRYTAQWDQWNIYDGCCWPADLKLAVDTLANQLCHEAASAIGNPIVARSVDALRTSTAVRNMARAIDPIPALAAQWDSDIWLLNTPDGAINLKLGDKDAFELRAGRAADYCTKMTAASPGGTCPVFLQFLFETTGGDKELETYLQMVFGLCLTGSTKEQVLFDIYGPPGTGKTTLVETISKAMGDYCVSSPVETFTESQHPQHPTELARLEGARLVTTTETADGHFLAESRVNKITGGEPIDARAMFKDFTTYYPQFKLLIAGNYRPRLKNPKGGIRRRVRLIPLNTPIAERDNDLAEKLRLEHGGILAWQIEGCRKWQEAGGLKSPKAVALATDEYLSSEDGMGRWLDERTEKNLLPVIAPSAALYSDYKQWGEAGKEFFYSAKRFGQELEARGFKPARTNTGRGFLGLKLLNRGEE